MQKILQKEYLFPSTHLQINNKRIAHRYLLFDTQQQPLLLINYKIMIAINVKALYFSIKSS